MNKIALILALMALVLAPKALIMGSEGVVGASSHNARENPLYANILAQEGASTSSQLELPDLTKIIPETPFDSLFDKLLGGTIKEKAQEGMVGAQNQLKQGVEAISESAQQAAKDAIREEADKTKAELKEGIAGAWERVKADIKYKMDEIISKIKLFFKELFSKRAPTY
jgi:cytochrome c556